MDVHKIEMGHKGRSPHGERGLKYRLQSQSVPQDSRSPHGERGLKSALIIRFLVIFSRSPHGERGLKSLLPCGVKAMSLSLPTRGAWIEIDSMKVGFPVGSVAPHTGSVD